MSSPGITHLGGPFGSALERQFSISQGPDGLRRFDNSHIQSAIDDALAAMGDDGHYAVVAHHVYNDDGTRIENVTKVSAVFRLKQGWSVGVGAYKDWSGGDQGVEGKVIFTDGGV